MRAIWQLTVYDQDGNATQKVENNSAEELGRLADCVLAEDDAQERHAGVTMDWYWDAEPADTMALGFEDYRPAGYNLVPDGDMEVGDCE